MEGFLAALRIRGSVTQACKAAMISRNTAYTHYRKRAYFRRRWDRAQCAGWDNRCDRELFNMLVTDFLMGNFKGPTGERALQTFTNDTAPTRSHALGKLRLTIALR